ncbi:MAG: alpha/beta hydrolase [Clostridia bacterium]|nr:alpha/beta hydrolase [Clostridia bacterium]
MEKLEIWSESIPGGKGEDGAPYLCYYPAENKTTSATVLIFAGGGYSHRSAHEGEGYAEKLNSWGMDAFVLEYRVNPHLFPFPLLDARRAMRFIRSRAKDFGIDPERIAVMGSSAGGHLAALLSTYRDTILGEGVDATDNLSAMPNMQILAYPVIDIAGHPGSFEMLLGDNISKHGEVTPTLLVTDKTPPAFIWHTSTDPVVDINNTFRYAAALHEAGVQMEMHVYPIGTHGAGLAVKNENPDRVIPYVQVWTDSLKRYLELYEYLK